MPRSTSKTPKCPVCKRETRKTDNPDFPFCSERCRIVDLGKWLNQDYAIPDNSTRPPLSQDPEWN